MIRLKVIGAVRRPVTGVVAATLLCTGLGALGATSPAAAAASGGKTCDPLTTQPRYRHSVPTSEQVLGYQLGSRKATDADIVHYVDAVDRASPRVVSGTLARSWEGRPLRFALVGSPSNLSDHALARIRADAAALRDPATPAKRVRRIERRMPAILWLSGNVHGNEEAAADASLQVLYDLAARTDCVARRILHNALVGIIPTQNPDGRAAVDRHNAYGFDMNRDWFARTQPETDGKIAELSMYPPMLYIDEHGMGGTSYFFPPNADPIYHEVSATSIDWIRNLYGAPLADAFTRKGLSFFTWQGPYDLFYEGYGDSVPTTMFGAAGMTFEVGGRSDYPVRTYKHYLSASVALYAGATHRDRLVRGWRHQVVEATQEGKACTLEPNQVYNPGSTVEFPVPDMRVCGYLIRTDDPGEARSAASVVRHLQRAGVDVYRITAPLRVPDYHAYGRAPEPTTLPPGTYWIPMAQAQKHWIQAMLNEDTYVPFPYFYDVSAWSMALLDDVDGGFTGTRLHPRAVKVPLVPEPSPPPRTTDPRIAVLGPPSHYGDFPIAGSSAGWLRWRLDKDWDVHYTSLLPGQIDADSLSDVDVLIVPDFSADRVYNLLGASGRSAVTAWVDGGGRYIGWQGGTGLAVMLGVSTARLQDSTSVVPGSLFRVRSNHPGDPLTAGVGGFDWVMYASDPVMRAGDRSDAVVSYPEADSPDWFVSGYQKGAEELGGTAAEIAEPVGEGESVVFSIEPNFRGFTDGSARLLFDAIFAPPVAAGHAPAIGSATRSTAEAKAKHAAARLGPLGDAIRVYVPSDQASATRRVLDRAGATYQVTSSQDRVQFRVPDRSEGLDTPPWVQRLPASLSRAGVHPIAVIVP